MSDVTNPCQLGFLLKSDLFRIDGRASIPLCIAALCKNRPYRVVFFAVSVLQQKILDGCRGCCYFRYRI